MIVMVLPTSDCSWDRGGWPLRARGAFAVAAPACISRPMAVMPACTGKRTWAGNAPSCLARRSTKRASTIRVTATTTSTTRVFRRRLHQVGFGFAQRPEEGEPEHDDLQRRRGDLPEHEGCDRAAPRLPLRRHDPLERFLEQHLHRPGHERQRRQPFPVPEDGMAEDGHQLRREVPRGVHGNGQRSQVDRKLGRKRRHVGVGRADTTAQTVQNAPRSVGGSNPSTEIDPTAVLRGRPRTGGGKDLPKRSTRGTCSRGTTYHRIAIVVRSTMTSTAGAHRRRALLAAGRMRGASPTTCPGHPGCCLRGRERPIHGRWDGGDT